MKKTALSLAALLLIIIIIVISIGYSAQADKNDAKNKAVDIIKQYYAECSAGYIINRTSTGWFDPMPYGILQYKKAEVNYSSNPISESDKLNGIEWQGSVSIDFSSPFRKLDNNKQWGPWSDGFELGILVHIQKDKGKDWEVTLVSTVFNKITCDDVQN